MNLQEAKSILQGECDNFPSGEHKTNLQLAIDVFNNESSAITNEAAINLTNDVYWDATLSDRLLFGQALFTVSYTVDQSNPSPHVRHS
jgi:hypothetical protein